MGDKLGDKIEQSKKEQEVEAKPCPPCHQNEAEQEEHADEESREHEDAVVEDDELPYVTEIRHEGISDDHVLNEFLKG